MKKVVFDWFDDSVAGGGGRRECGLFIASGRSRHICITVHAYSDEKKLNWHCTLSGVAKLYSGSEHSSSNEPISFLILSRSVSSWLDLQTTVANICGRRFKLHQAKQNNRTSPKRAWLEVKSIFRCVYRGWPPEGLFRASQLGRTSERQQHGCAVWL